MTDLHTDPEAPDRSGGPAATRRSRMHRALGAVESWTVLDKPAELLRTRLRGSLDGTRADTVLRGRPLGHAAHPLFVTLPIGCWSAALLLDAVPGQERTARHLTGMGLAAAVPSAITGWADWSALDVRQRRVGLVHAGSNVVAISCFAVSYLRRRTRRSRATPWALAGFSAMNLGGALGGHLTYAMGAGVGRWQDDNPARLSEPA